ncbi:hypothetical protein Q4E93_09920 [Flavitalea sp. BT771]|uniref:hypothetical protein n=1 Tax=Flavitalea sp. BT771 TaxID=3063329 RepID=UPI0026E23222|nr:hypothetical protein [Flavitalea sp. BT771]MDO6430904.1 hypothetical protein [Flavitalea sp. BT771]MDV6218956.1 hypothetical protein [Flavitalea sp. BT771]
MQQLKEGNPTTMRVIPKSSFYKPDKSAKQLCIAWETGGIEAFHYRDLLRTSFRPEVDPNTIKLYFVGCCVRMKGNNLDSLAYRLLQHEPELIAVTPSRYIALSDVDQFVVNEVTIDD